MGVLKQIRGPNLHALFKLCVRSPACQSACVTPAHLGASSAQWGRMRACAVVFACALMRPCV
eukprot:1809304-Pleurochrysis_carterae.AAC.1